MTTKTAETKKNKAKKVPPKTVSTRSAKTATTRSAANKMSTSTRPKPGSEELLWEAAAAAWHAAADGWVSWDGAGSMAEAARFFYWRARKGFAAVEIMRSALKSDGHAGNKYFEQPAGFKNFARLADQLFAEIGIDPNVEIAVGSMVKWSVYHLEIVHEESDPLYCARGEKDPEPSLIAGIAAYGRVYDPLMTTRRKKATIVINGRQRTNATWAHNKAELVRFYGALERGLRYREPQHQLLEVAFVAEDIPPPALVCMVPIVMHALEDGRKLKAVSNAHRLAETLLDEARATWDLEDELKAKGQGAETWIVGQIAKLRGCSDQTVYNLLSLRKLIAEWQGLLTTKDLPAKLAYRLAREPAARQKACWSAFSKARKTEGLTLKCDPFVGNWLDGKTEPTALVKPVSPKIKAQVYDCATRLRTLLKTTGVEGSAAQVLDVLEALEEGAAPNESGALSKLPPAWRVALLGQQWAKDIEAGWKAIGVIEPATPHYLASACSNVCPDWWDGEDADECLLEFASRPWGDSGVSIGAAYEQRLMTLDDVKDLLEAEKDEAVKDDDEDEDADADADPPPRRNQRLAPELQTPQLALPAAAADPEASDERPAKSKRNTWYGFTLDEREAWKAAGVTNYLKAMELRAEGLTPDQLACVLPEGADRPLGALYTDDVLTVLDVKRLLEAASSKPVGSEGAAA